MTESGAAASRSRGLPSSRRSLLCLILGLHVCFLAYEATEDAPTVDEPAHLAAGVFYWQFHRFDLYLVDPPLVRLVAAAPVAAIGCQADWRAFDGSWGARPEFAIGDAFININGATIFPLVRLARYACLPFSLLGAWICFRWAAECYGGCAGLTALAMWCFSPTILAHGHLITGDVPGAALGLLSAWLFWRWLREATWERALLAGGALGLAWLAKSTSLVLGLIFPVIWALHRLNRSSDLPRAGRAPRRSFLLLIVIGAAALYVLNLGYGFEGALFSLREILADPSSSHMSQQVIAERPASLAERLAGSPLGAMPLPFPRDFVRGIHLQLIDTASENNWSYWHGTVSRTGWWHFYLDALAVKEPVGFWALGLLAAFTCRVRRGAAGSVPGRWCLPLCAGTLLGLVSSFHGNTEHFRYAIPALPFLYIWISGVAQVFENKRSRWRPAVAACLVWAMASSLWAFPHSLAYFNELAGGPLCGSRFLWGSNVDWGQDLLRLKRWINSHADAGRPALAYCGRVNPRLAGIRYVIPPRARSRGNAVERPPLKPGWYAVSVNFLAGMPAIIPRDEGNFADIGPGDLSYFRGLPVRERVGYTICLYRIDDTAGQATAASAGPSTIRQRARPDR